MRAASPFPVTAAGAFPIISTNTLNVAAPNPLPVSIQNQTSTVTVAISNTPVPAIVVSPIPISTTTLTASSERVGSGTFTLVTPSSGKKISLRGVAITMQSAAGEVDIRFSGGQLIHKVYRGDQTGDYIPIFRDGAVNESVQGVTSGIAGGSMVFFIVTYEEK